jgi:hypothetical protein
VGAIADDRDVDLHVLVDGGRVDVHMDAFRIGREGIEPPGDAVIETRPDIDHDVAFMHRQIGLVGAVHAQHS